MDAARVAKTLLVRAVEESDPEALPAEALVDAILEAGELDDDAEWLARRAEHLFGRLGPAYRSLLALAAAPAPRAWPVVALAALAGLASNYLGPSRKIHVAYNPLAALLLWNLAVYALLVAGALRRRAPRPVRLGSLAAALRRGVVPGLWVRLHGGERGAAGGARARVRVAREFLAAWSAASRPLRVPALRRLLHLGALGLGLGAVGGMFVRGLFLDYQVVWRSTFLTDPELVARLLRAAFGWAAALAALPAPDAAAVRSMMTPEGVGAGPWIAVYAICALALILAPRAGLAAWEGARLRSRERRLAFDLSDAYARTVLARAREARVEEIEQTIRNDLEAESARFAEAVAGHVEASLYAERIAPRLRRFRDEGGRVDALEAELAAACEALPAELEQELERGREAFERGLAERLAASVGSEVALRLPSAGALGSEVDRFSRDSTRSLGGALEAELRRIVAVSLTGALGLVAGTVSGGFGHKLGLAIAVALLGTSGPVGFLIGAVAGVAAAGGAYWAGRERLTGAIRRVALPGALLRVALPQARFERLLADGGGRCREAVEAALREKLDELAPEIASQIWRKVKPALGERQRVRSGDGAGG